MPVYDYKCGCGYVINTVWTKMDEYPPCPTCGTTLQRIIGNYFIVPDINPYLDEHIADKPVWVKSKKHRKELMREHGVQEIYGKKWY